MRRSNVLKKLESLDYVVEGNLIIPALFMTDDQYARVIDEYMDGVINFKSVPLPRRRA